MPAFTRENSLFCGVRESLFIRLFYGFCNDVSAAGLERQPYSFERWLDRWESGYMSASDEKVCQTTAVQIASGTHCPAHILVVREAILYLASPIGLEECTALTECHWLLLRIYSDLFPCWPVCPPGLSPGRCNQPPLCYDRAFGNKRHGRWRYW